VSRAQRVTPPQPTQQPTALLTLTLRGAQRSLTDTVKGVLIEHDPPKDWGLLITGSKGKGQFTCEVRSNDRQALFDLQRAVLFSKEVSVTCANGTPSSRGGVLIDLDDPKGGSLVVAAER
jgi:hypothetical protein